MKVCFVGLGSIAKRHIRNLNDLYPNIQVDVLRHSCSIIPDDMQGLICSSYNIVSQLDNYDAIFITNPTSMHYETLKELKGYSSNFFIEKPVFESGNEDLKQLCLSEGVYYVACPLRYTNIISYLKENIDSKSVYSVRAISSSYLPEWRPGIDYRNTYSAKKELGGGVSIDLIHEWDYLSYLFGTPKTVHSIISKKSSLEINSDDIAIYIAEYDKITVELHLDYFGRVPIRRLELICEEDTIEADLICQVIHFKKDNKTINLAEDRDSYQKKELQHFFSIVSGSEKNDNTIEQACRTLRIARGVF